MATGALPVAGQAMARLTVAAIILLALSLSCLRESRAPEETVVPAESDAPLPEAQLPEVPEELTKAGVCARCHVLSVFEWGVSRHVEEGTTCKRCHGQSKAHVANERNEVPPDRLPRGDDIADLCLDCHDDGCPETEREDACQECHHPHALVHPDVTRAPKTDRLEELRELWQSYDERMAAGEKLVEESKWKDALDEFRAADHLVAGDDRARARIGFCERRLNPVLEGFEVVGNDFDAVTGLPRRVRVVGTEMTLLLVSPGKFDMGADHLEGSRPVHTVRVGAFYLGEFEVTQGEWERVMGSNPSAYQEIEGENAGSPDRLPVETVSWDDCQDFVAKLNEAVPGGGFRLPTEAEWEFACRAGGDGASDDALDEFAWFSKNSRTSAESDEPFKDIRFHAPRPVGTRKPNAWGFYDMQGNVREWCAGEYHEYVTGTSPGGEAKRVLRGGGFQESAAFLHPAFRHPERPYRHFRFYGLRVARTVVP